MQAIAETTEIADFFKDGPIKGSQILEGLITIAKMKGQHQEVVTPIATVRYFGQESITNASVTTLREGVKSRLPDNFPSGVEEVHVYFGTDLDDYVALVEKEGQYALKG